MNDGEILGQFVTLVERYSTLAIYDELYLKFLKQLQKNFDALARQVTHISIPNEPAYERDIARARECLKAGFIDLSVLYYLDSSKYQYSYTKKGVDALTIHYQLKCL